MITFWLYVCAVDALPAPSAWRQQVRVLARGRCTVGVVAGAVVHAVQLGDGTG